ncbi:MAG: DUF6489 family protein [Alphaproteobacteria bacterium]|nr:DUF6489 family protein [Alphaproteobacteria bacterium]
MKITVDIDCAPQEARHLMGMPDLSEVQREGVEEMRKRLLANLDTMDPQAMLRILGPMGAEGWEQFQKMFWSGLASTTPDKDD